MPDANITPHATGAAAKTVEEHQAPQELIFYAGWFCPFVQRSWISLEEKGIPYQYKEVNPYKKEKHFLDINPRGLVPAVESKGTALYESLILCEFFEDAYPDHKHLLPVDPISRAVARIWMDHIAQTLFPAFRRLLQAQETEKQDIAREELYTSLRKLAAETKGPYFFGEEFSLVDIAIAPWIVRDYFLKDHRGYERSHVSDAWKAYADHVEIRDSVVNTSSEKEFYNEIYGRFLPEKARSEAAKA